MQGFEYPPLPTPTLISEIWLNVESCNRKLCSFQHEQSKSSLNDDKDSNEEDVKIKCDYCLFRSQNKSELKMHTEKRHKLKCKKCDYKTTSGLDLQEHQRSKRHR